MQATVRVGRASLVTIPPEIREIMEIERGDFVVVDFIQVIKPKKMEVGDIIG